MNYLQALIFKLLVDEYDATLVKVTILVAHFNRYFQGTRQQTSPALTLEEVALMDHIFPVFMRHYGGTFSLCGTDMCRHQAFKVLSALSNIRASGAIFIFSIN